jgi:hypothetical protein
MIAFGWVKRRHVTIRQHQQRIGLVARNPFYAHLHT